MRKPADTTLLLDMDGVLADWEHGFERVYRQVLPDFEPIPAGERPSFELYIEGREYEHHAIQTILDYPGFYIDLNPMPGAVEAVDEMLTAGYDLAICTAPTVTNPTCASDKYNWVIKHFGLNVAERVIITRDKTRVIGDFLIDDKPEVVGKNPNPTWEHIYFHARYNQDIPGRRRIKDWSSWREVVEGKLESSERAA